MTPVAIGHQPALVPGLHPPPDHAVGTDHPDVIRSSTTCSDAIAAGLQHDLLLAQRPQIQVRLK
ncbi:hypothetical protein [Actinomadura rubrisoli]|uniref:Uncharacterized protein n=1 Tax=Actinomadura rubrisoli TaxID=2530368 RepID=A0A4R5C388_9ACTN|nr:hypothetical protein [Actinomadura rubrisoli]TDD93335.1 hypothetical protein E1298_10140 [Actinomadura rubrisoli]